MHPLTKTLLALADAGAYKCTVIAVVINADGGVTVRDLAGMLSCSPYSVKYTLRRAVGYGWLRTTGEMRGNCCVYARTFAGNQLTDKITCPT